MSRTYSIDSKPFISEFFDRDAFVLRDDPQSAAQPVQTLYLNEVMGFFLRTLVKVYAAGELSDKDKANLKRYLDKVIEAKDAIDGKVKGGREY
jgi:hypothetical protein